MGISKKLKRGFTLVELMIVVAIIGILAALAIYGVRRYVLNAKTAEARNTVGGIAKAAGMSYDRDSMAGAVLTLGSTAGVSNSLCGSAGAAVPAVAKIKGQKYQSTPTDWNGDVSIGWKCLMFMMEQPQYFQYNYTAPGATRALRGATGATFSAIAVGDLDGDAATSTFTLRGELQTVTGGGMAVTVSPAIEEVNPDE